MQSILSQNAVIQWRKQNNGEILLKSSGDWTLDTLKDTANTLDEISRTNRNVHIRWEVADVGRVDSAGMMLFIRSYNVLKANNCAIEIIGAKSEHEKMYRLLCRYAPGASRVYAQLPSGYAIGIKKLLNYDLKELNHYLEFENKLLRRQIRSCHLHSFGRLDGIL